MDIWKRWVAWRSQLFPEGDGFVSSIQNELKSGKAFFHRQDKKGNVCLVVKMEKHKKAESSPQDLINFFIYMVEKGLCLCEQSAGAHLTVIWDRKGFTKENFDLNLITSIKQMLRIFQDYYADILDKCYVLYPGWIISS